MDFGYLTKKKKPKTPNSKRSMYPYVHCNTIYNSQDIEASVFTDGWIKMWYIIYIYLFIYTHNEILLSHRNEWNPDICNYMVALGGYCAR